MNSLDLNSEYMNHLSPQYSEAAAAATKMELSAVDQPIMYQGMCVCVKASLVLDILTRVLFRIATIVLVVITCASSSHVLS